MSVDQQDLLENTRERIHSAYAGKRPKSHAMFDQAQRCLPGGDTRSVTFFKPFPSFMACGEGSRLYDVDGWEYIDFVNNMTSLIHGHAHPKVVEAVIEQVRRGSAFAAPVESQFELARIICDRLPSAEKVRFCNSGTEATMGAIRLARAHTKKHRIVKMEGGYHGSHDLVEISVRPPLNEAGPIEAPNSVPEDDSVPHSAVEECIVVPFNQPRIAEEIIARNRDVLAAVIVEPVQGAAGMIPADTEFLQVLRDVTTRYRIPLIFDEVYTFRLSMGGYQKTCQVTPDITALGKFIGGGYPVGAIAGTEQFMQQFSPLRPSFLTHSGTFNGNPVTMAAGVATMLELTQSLIDKIDSLGHKLREGLRQVLFEEGVQAQVTGCGSLAQVHFTTHAVRDWRGAATCRADIRAFLQLLLMKRGVFAGGKCSFNISTVMGDEEILAATSAFRDSLRELRTYFEQSAPDLVAQR